MENSCKSVLISGGATGIGLACVNKFTALGFQTILLYHKSQKEALELQKQAEGQIEIFHWDALAAPTNVALRDFLQQRKGTISGLVVNHGIYHRKQWASLTNENWQTTLTINLDGAFGLAKTVEPFMEDGGSVVLISSQLGQKGSAQGIDYSASKAGMEGLTKSLALALAPRQIRVNCVAPGFTDTAILAGDSPAKRAQRELEVPLGRIARPDEIAGVITFLLGDEASYITGAIIPVNGGLYL